MVKTFSRSLSKKKVMSTDGLEMGTISNVMVDLDSGQVLNLVVRPHESFDTSHYHIEGERMLIPFESVKDIRDYIVVDRYLSKK